LQKNLPAVYLVLIENFIQNSLKYNNYQTEALMNIRNSLLLTLALLPSVELYGMITPFQPNNSQAALSTTFANNTPTLKRPSENPIDFTGVEKKARIEELQPLESPLSTKIKKTMYNFDPVALGDLLISNEAAQLSKDQKEELHVFAKTHKTNVKEMRAMGHKIASQSDSQEIKTKFSYDSEYNNTQKISRYLYAFKTLPKLTFPQAFFTNAPYVKDLQPKTTPNQALIALIKNEQDTVSICCFSFDLMTIAEALVSKKKDGILVEVITDQEQGQKPNALKVINLLRDNNINVLSPQGDNFEHCHHKFSLFKRNLLDKPLLCHGSFNYTDSALKRNWEDMTISDDSEIVEAFDARFKEVKDRSTAFKFVAPIIQQQNKPHYYQNNHNYQNNQQRR